jgi:holliday junction DNA helicase RuvA
VIGRIAGILIEKNPPQVLVDVNGVAYEVSVPMSTFYNLPANQERTTLFTHLVVREDAHLLFGFATEGERSAFRQLLTVNGVGPKVALAVLSGLSVNDLAEAIARQDPGRLTKIPGIGKKTAERLLLELRDKLKLPAGSVEVVGGAASGYQDVLNALAALGYHERELQPVVKQLPSGLSVGEAIRHALKALAKA